VAAKLLTPEQLARVYEKLKQADQNILNLSVEISAFSMKARTRELPETR
jgi:hypothetical protein